MSKPTKKSACPGCEGKCDGNCDCTVEENKNASPEVRAILEKTLWNQDLVARYNRLKDAVLEDDRHELEAVVAPLKAQILELAKTVGALKEDLAFNYVKGRPVLVVRLGSEARGWVPAPHHFAKVQRVLKESGVDEKYNILLFHFGIATDLLARE